MGIKERQVVPPRAVRFSEGREAVPEGPAPTSCQISRRRFLMPLLGRGELSYMMAVLLKTSPRKPYHSLVLIIFTKKNSRNKKTPVFS
jgi:hypothetical protein